MNSVGSARIRDVIDYLLYDDDLSKYVPGCSRKKQDALKKSTDYIELLL